MDHDLLSTIPLFAQLPPDERSELVAMLKAQPYPANRPIFWLGEQGESFYIVQHGKVVISCPDESGKEVILGHLGPGQFFGEISLLDGGPRTATVRTGNNEVTLLSLSRSDFLEFLRRHPDAAIYMLQILGQRLRETNEKIRGIRNVNEAVAEKQTRWHLIAERVAGVSASQWYVTLNLAFIAGWIIINIALERLGHTAFDPPPAFGTLASLITIEALFISLFVLINQGHQGTRDRIRADLDYQVNLKNHQEVMQLHRKLDRLQSVVGVGGAEQLPSALEPEKAEV